MRWKSDIPLTDGQLMSKRDEFWDTAPAFEGLKCFTLQHDITLKFCPMKVKPRSGLR